LILSFLVQAYFWIGFLISAKRNKVLISNQSETRDPVSVILTIRNNTEALKKNLPYLTNQNYENFELIIVDDGSSEESFRSLEDFVNEYGDIKLIRNQTSKREGGKRAAIALGLKKAKGDFILFTDSDCRPASSKWILNMMKGVHSPKTDLVIGISPYLKAKGILNKLIQFETLHSASLMIGFLNLGKPYMGLGRNLLIRKDTLKASSALDFAPLISGDDDLTVNKIANAGNTTYVSGYDAYVFTENDKSLKEYIHQKRRHFSAGKYYRTSDKFRLGLLAISQAVFLLSGLILLLLFPEESTVVLGIFLFRSIFVVGKLQLNSKEFSMPIAWCWIFIFDLFLPLYYLVFSSHIFVKDIKRW
jgi:biofilm PGA synthesis N-glycosyltransferase PgaC